jgi:outer membrane lipoprotein-sorting protein
MIRLPVLLCITAFCGLVQADPVSVVLARMDKAAPAFHGITAKVTMVTYTKIIDDKSVETGTLQMQRISPKDVRAIMVLSSAGQSSRTLAFTGNNVRMYFADSNSYQDYDLGKSGSNVLNSYLLLGFGSSGTDLSKNYEITYLAEESVNQVKASKLQLIPKDKGVLEHLTKVYIWIPEEGDPNPVQQQFFEPNGNYREVTYSDLQPNPKFPPSELKKGQLDFEPPKSAKQIKQ